jgi:hypothetical protein
LKQACSINKENVINRKFNILLMKTKEAGMVSTVEVKTEKQCSINCQWHESSVGRAPD